MENVNVRVKLGTTVVGGPWQVPITGAGYNGGPVELNITEYAVKIAYYTLSWEISEDNQNWRSIGNSGPHKVYWTMGSPVSPTFVSRTGNQFPELYDCALDEACAMASSQVTSLGAFNTITAGVSASLVYDPGEFLDENAHPMLAFSPNQPCLCTDHAVVTRGLLRSIGLESTTQFLFGGSSPSTFRFFRVNRAMGFSTFLKACARWRHSESALHVPCSPRNLARPK
jgi:hypothetical protein